MLERHHALGPAPIQPDGSCCGCPSPEGNCPTCSPCYVAASHGHLPCLQMAAQVNFISRSAYQVAARRGSLQCLRFLCETARYPTCNYPSIRVCNCAIWGGHMNFLQHLLEHGCRMHKTHCPSAAAAGQLKCSKYLSSMAKMSMRPHNLRMCRLCWSV